MKKNLLIKTNKVWHSLLDMKPPENIKLKVRDKHYKIHKVVYSSGVFTKTPAQEPIFNVWEWAYNVKYN